jgi:Calx-beta domain
VRDKQVENGVVIGTEYEPQKAAIAQANFQAAGLSAFIELREDDLRQTLRDVGDPTDEQPRLQFASPTVTVSEGAGVANLTVMRVGPTTGIYTVGYALAGVTATGGADFVATGGTLTFGPGITSRVISVPIVADTLNEPRRRSR